jgi:hypothetical protein
MRSAVAIGLVMLGVLPGSALAAPVVEPLSVSRTVAIPADAARSVILTCPGTAVALHAAASSERGSDSIPGSNPKRWTFRFTPDGAPRRVRTVLRCVQLRVPAEAGGVRLVVGTTFRPDVAVAAGSGRSVALTCRRGQAPTGWGLERGDGGGSIALAGVARTPRGFRFQLDNTGGAVATATPRIRCLERTQRADAGLTHSFRLRTASFEDSGRTARHSCRTGEYSISAGIRIEDADDVFLTGAMPTRARGARWRLSEAAAATTELVCLARGTRFGRAASTRLGRVRADRL